MQWSEVSSDQHELWRRTFNAEPDVEDLSAGCPLCAEPALHRWYHLDGQDEVHLSGRRYLGHGRLWEWCAACGSFEYFGDGFVPDWWRSDLVVADELLTWSPMAVEESRRRAP